MQKLSPSQARDFYQTLKNHLSPIAGADQTFRAFEHDPAAGSEQLARFLRGHVPNDLGLADKLATALSTDNRPQFITEVSSGHVDQIINIARLGVLNLTIKRQLFLFRDVRQLLIVLGVLLIVSASAVYGYFKLQEPQAMTGDFNIAVAEFGQVAANGRLVSTDITQSLSNGLFAALDSAFTGNEFGLNVQVEHENIGFVRSKQAAEELAEAINANMVIFGTVDQVSPDSTELTPMFWVREIPDAAELTGQDRLGRPILFESDKIRYGDQISVTMRKRLSVLVSLIKGVVFLDDKQTDQALRLFREAKDQMDALGGCTLGNRDESTGCELVHLLIGKAYGALKEYTRAEASYRQALAHNPEYARAYLGLGNVYYAKAIADNFDSGYLDQARAYVEEALLATDSPPSAFVMEKAKVMLGNAYVVRAQQLNDQSLFNQATELYLGVIDELESIEDPEIREQVRDILATAYFGLGAAYERQWMVDDAIAAYQRCSELTTSSDLKERAQQQIKGIEAVG